MIQKLTLSFNNLTSPFIVMIWFVAFAGQALRYNFGWVGFSFIAFSTIFLSFWLFKDKFRLAIKTVPYPLAIFITWCLISVLWSNYKLETLLGSGIQIATALLGVLLAYVLSWPQLLSSLSAAFKLILASSFILELYVSLFLQKPLMPLIDGVEGFAWVNGQLLLGGEIQGIVGNRNLLGFIALLAVCVFAVQFFQQKKISILLWLAVAFTAIACTRSATITIALCAVAVLTILVLIMRKLLVRNHKYLYYFGGGGLILMLSACVVYSSTLLAFLGRDDDFTGRTNIWRNVLNLWKEHPIEGWGWIGHWAPWVKPFDSLAVFDNTRFLHAHNAAIDVLFQTGVIGGLLALSVAVIVSIRSWRIAVAPSSSVKNLLNVVPYRTILPVLLIACLLVQSLSESRLLLEGNWLLFVFLCCKVKTDAPSYGSFNIKRNIK
jgi:exopolysaccharide production protein ExoQ